jgi:hypothetical protein
VAQATAFCGHRGLARVHPPRLRVGRSEGASSESEKAEGGKGVRRTDDKGKGLIRKGGCFASLRAKQPRQRSDGRRGATTTVKGKALKGAARRGETGAVARAPRLPPWRLRLLEAVDPALVESGGLPWELGTIRTWPTPDGLVVAVERRLRVGEPPFSDGR